MDRAGTGAGSTGPGTGQQDTVRRRLCRVMYARPFSTCQPEQAHCSVCHKEREWEGEEEEEAEQMPSHTLTRCGHVESAMGPADSLLNLTKVAIRRMWHLISGQHEMAKSEREGDRREEKGREKSVGRQSEKDTDWYHIHIKGKRKI